MVTPTADEPFLRAVVAAPDNDLPRLVYADWLEERGDAERAEFIRVQVELAQFSPVPQGKCPGGCKKGLKYGHSRGCRWLAFSRRQNHLTFNPESYAKIFYRPCEGVEWDCELGAPYFTDVTHDDLTKLCLFIRGFPAHITCSAADWLAHAGAILDACPIRRVWRVTKEHPQGHWSGDGLVRLTTLPDTQYNDPGNPVRIRLRGREWREVGCVSETDHAGRLLRLLAAEWPGVRFKLPAEPTTQADGLLAWVTADVRRAVRAMEGMHELSTEGD